MTAIVSKVTQIHVYNRESGLFQYTDIGVAEYVIMDVEECNDYTLTPPPNQLEQWHWIDGQWTTDTAE